MLGRRRCCDDFGGGRADQAGCRDRRGAAGFLAVGGGFGVVALFGAAIAATPATAAAAARRCRAVGRLFHRRRSSDVVGFVLRSRERQRGLLLVSLLLRRILLLARFARRAGLTRFAHLVLALGLFLVTLATLAAVAAFFTAFVAVACLLLGIALTALRPLGALLTISLRFIALAIAALATTAAAFAARVAAAVAAFTTCRFGRLGLGSRCCDFLCFAAEP